MIWMEYTLESFPDGSFHVIGDWPGEVMGWTRDGEKSGGKDSVLYSPGDVFVVDDNGILRKADSLKKLIEQTKWI